MNDFVEIALTKGKVAIIDTEDFERVCQWKWTTLDRQWKGREICYARRNQVTRQDGKVIQQRSVLLHRFIINAAADLQVDHINGNGLDCRKANLRLATRSQNQSHSFKQANNRTGFRGVEFDKRCFKKFSARIQLFGERIHLGRFQTAEEAAKAYDKKAIEVFKEFATLNFPSQ